MKVLQQLPERTSPKRQTMQSNAGSWILVLLLCVASSVTACSSDKAHDQTGVENSATSLNHQEGFWHATSLSQQVADGELVAVNIPDRTLTVRDSSGTERKFSFSDNTGIIGAPGAQGLLGMRGSHIRVGYTPASPATPGDAAWIEIETTH